MRYRASSLSISICGDPGYWRCSSVDAEFSSGYDTSWKSVSSRRPMASKCTNRGASPEYTQDGKRQQQEKGGIQVSGVSEYEYL